MHFTELAEIQVDVSEVETPALTTTVTSATPIPLPNIVILLEPVDTIPCRTLETMGELNETPIVDWAGDDSNVTDANTEANLIEPADDLATKELSENQALDSQEVWENFNAAEGPETLKPTPDKVKKIAPESGELPAIDRGIGAL